MEAVEYVGGAAQGGQVGHSASFGIQTADDFFQKVLLPQHQEFIVNNASARYALLTILAAYHMYEWANSSEKFSVSRFKMRYPKQASLVDDFELAKDITNGTKHFRNKKTSTRAQAGFSSGFSYGFARSLVIVRADGTEISVDELLDKLVGFWKDRKAAGAF